MAITSIEARELAVRLRSDRAPKILDVRDQWELKLARLEGTIDVPMTQIPENLEQLAKEQGNRDLVVMCHSGKRSAVIANYLQQNGFERVINLEGGISAWAEQVDQSLPIY